jgi:hypothetical protein
MIPVSHRAYAGRRRVRYPFRTVPKTFFGLGTETVGTVTFGTVTFGTDTLGSVTRGSGSGGGLGTETGTAPTSGTFTLVGVPPDAGVDPPEPPDELEPEPPELVEDAD